MVSLCLSQSLPCLSVPQMALPAKSPAGKRSKAQALAELEESFKEFYNPMLIKTTDVLAFTSEEDIDKFFHTMLDSIKKMDSPTLKDFYEYLTEKGWLMSGDRSPLTMKINNFGTKSITNKIGEMHTLLQMEKVNIMGLIPSLPDQPTTQSYTEKWEEEQEEVQIIANKKRKAEDDGGGKPSVAEVQVLALRQELNNVNRAHSKRIKELEERCATLETQLVSLTGTVDLMQETINSILGSQNEEADGDSSL